MKLSKIFIPSLACFLSVLTLVVALPLRGVDAGKGAKPERKIIKPADETVRLPELLSGKSFLQPELQALQDNDFANPGMLVMSYGASLWSKKEGAGEKSCAGCHNEARNAMAVIGVRYPVFNRDLKKPVTVAKRINICREKHMKVSPWVIGSDAMVALTAYIKHQSRGRKINLKVGKTLEPFLADGRKFFYRRRGQLNMSCAHCHEKSFGKSLRGRVLSQGHGNGFPAYSMSQEKVLSLHQQFQACNERVRAEPFGLGSDEYVNLELYLAWRARGLPVETPALRH